MTETIFVVLTGLLSLLAIIDMALLLAYRLWLTRHERAIKRRQATYTSQRLRQ